MNNLKLRVHCLKSSIHTAVVGYGGLRSIGMAPLQLLLLPTMTACCGCCCCCCCCCGRGAASLELLGLSVSDCPGSAVVAKGGGRVVMQVG
jgi:hypothetical protein